MIVQSGILGFWTLSIIWSCNITFWGVNLSLSSGAVKGKGTYWGPLQWANLNHLSQSVVDIRPCNMRQWTRFKHPTIQIQACVCVCVDCFTVTDIFIFPKVIPYSNIQCPSVWVVVDLIHQAQDRAQWLTYKQNKQYSGFIKANNFWLAGKYQFLKKETVPCCWLSICLLKKQVEMHKFLSI